MVCNIETQLLCIRKGKQIKDLELHRMGPCVLREMR